MSEEDIKEPELGDKPKRIILEFFPPEYIALQRELVFGEYHPKLVPILANLNANDIDMKLAHIAAYCEVALDGEYDFEGRIQLCKILLERLITLRKYPQAQTIVQLH